MDPIAEQRIVDLHQAGSWPRLMQALSGLQLAADAGPALLLQWLHAVPPAAQAQAQSLLRLLASHHWLLRPETAQSLVLSCAAGRWRLRLRQVPRLGIGSIEVLSTG